MSPLAIRCVVVSKESMDDGQTICQEEISSGKPLGTALRLISHRLRQLALSWPEESTLGTTLPEEHQAPSVSGGDILLKASHCLGCHYNLNRKGLMRDKAGHIVTVPRYSPPST